MKLKKTGRRDQDLVSAIGGIPLKMGPLEWGSTVFLSTAVLTTEKYAKRGIKSFGFFLISKENSRGCRIPLNPLFIVNSKV